MKKVIGIVLAMAVLGGVAFAQDVVFYNRFGVTFVEQEPAPNASAYFGDIYDFVHGEYHSEKFALAGRARIALDSNDGWKTTGVGMPLIWFNGVMRPLPFLEVALGNSYGKERHFGEAGYELFGGYGYGSDIHYGVSRWAQNEGLTVLLKGAGLGIDGLYFGWNLLTEKNAGQLFGDNSNDHGWQTALGLSYNIEGLASLGLGGTFNTKTDSNQEFGVYGQFSGVENLKVGLGVSMNTKVTAEHIMSTVELGTGGGVNAPAGFSSFLNAGVEYKLGQLKLGADFGMLLGAMKYRNNLVRDDATVMPMLVGALVTFDILEEGKMWTDLRVVYANSLGSNGGPEVAKLTITPRVYFNTGDFGAFRLDIGIPTVWTGDKSNTGFNIGAWWQYNF